MTDFATTIVTGPDAPAPLLESVIWMQNSGQYFGPEMKAYTTPSTVPDGTGKGGSRPTVGLVFPH